MKKATGLLLWAIVLALVIPAPSLAGKSKRSTTTPTTSSPGKKTPATSSPASSSSSPSSISTPSPASAGLETKPGPVHETVLGKIIKIEGTVYVMEDYTGRQVRMHVGKDTKKILKAYRPGDSIRAELTRDGHANSIN